MRGEIDVKDCEGVRYKKEEEGEDEGEDKGEDKGEDEGEDEGVERLGIGLKGMVWRMCLSEGKRE